jgi:hypothetical protein
MDDTERPAKPTLAGLATLAAAYPQNANAINERYIRTDIAIHRPQRSGETLPSSDGPESNTETIFGFEDEPPLIDDIGRFLDSPFCAEAAALGWSPYDLFGADRERPFARVDQMGLLWLVNGRPLLGLARDHAVIGNPRTSPPHTYRRKPGEPGRVLVWELVQ